MQGELDKRYLVLVAMISFGLGFLVSWLTTLLTSSLVVSLGILSAALAFTAYLALKLASRFILNVEGMVLLDGRQWQMPGNTLLKALV